MDHLVAPICFLLLLFCCFLEEGHIVFKLWEFHRFIKWHNVGFNFVLFFLSFLNNSYHPIFLAYCSCAVSWHFQRTIHNESKIFPECWKIIYSTLIYTYLDFFFKCFTLNFIWHWLIVSSFSIVRSFCYLSQSVFIFSTLNNFEWGRNIVTLLFIPFLSFKYVEKDSYRPTVLMCVMKNDYSYALHSTFQ